MESISGENGWCSPSPFPNWPLPNVWLGSGPRPGTPTGDPELDALKEYPR